MKRHLLLASALALVTGLPGFAGDLEFASGSKQVALLELYTSEGCSSCPPADRALSRYVGDAALWREVVPVAFHVNYWDSLGWKDPFASREFTAREYAYSHAWCSDSVYTPCFVRNGREWRLDRRAPAAAPAGELTLHSLGPDRWQVKFTTPETAAFEVTVALLGGGIRSRVRAGENGGHTLDHEFVALQLRTVPLVRGEDGGFSAGVEIRDPRTGELPRVAIAAWVTATGELAPLQATGGWISR